MNNHTLAFLEWAIPGGIIGTIVVLLVGLVVATGFIYAMLYRKVRKGTALIRTGFGGTRINFNGMIVAPIFHRLETMDISLKRIEIDRTAKNGLICRDNVRADIKVAFFVRVNHADDDVLRVAQSVGCERASSQDAIRELFDAKFSEALKTVGKRFDFISLYEDRDTFRDEILKVIGTDLNGFVLDDAAIDYLEQTPVESLDPDNILDAEGIKKITHLTAEQAKLSNNIQRDKEKVIKQQDVEAREAILELERQLAETEAKQQREVFVVQAREEAETQKVREEEHQKAERARISAEEEIEVATENKERQVLVALRNKERTDVVEVERVKRDQQLEAIERERITTLKDIDKEKAVEVEKKAIQDVIKERVAVEKLVVAEQERIKDTEAFAGADREKQVKVTIAEAVAQEDVIRRVKEAEADQESAKLIADKELYERVKAAEAEKKAAELHAEEVVIAAEAEQASSEKISTAKKMLAEATTKESAAVGLGEVEVLVATADATQKQGAAEAEVDRLKFDAEAQGIHQKAEAMKLFEEAGQGHEEFKLELEKQKTVELAEINIQKDIAEAQAGVLGEAMKAAKIEIIGGEGKFFEQIAGAVSSGKSVDRIVEHSDAIRDVKDTFFNGDPDYFKSQLKEWAGQFGVTADDVRDLTIGAALSKLLVEASGETRSKLLGFLGGAERFGLADEKASKVLK
ncbi:flotillin family protein [Haloferula sp.]|uniref:flotillin family protein n=1 Tax=Haloferula sp. TaxID=2497595 RepID=UPI00329C59CA